MRLDATRRSSGSSARPFDAGTEIEIRQVFETEDFGDELTPELRESEARLREQTEARSN